MTIASSNPNWPVDLAFPRRRFRSDRRVSPGNLIEHLSASLWRSPTAVSAVACLDEVLRRAIPIEAIHITPDAAPAGKEIAVRSGAILLEIPVPPGESRIRLRILTKPGYAPDHGDLELLRAAARLVAIVTARSSRARDAAVGAAQRARSRDVASRPLIGSSDAISAVLDHIERFAATEFTVLICGESGTGKELVARMLHERSRRRDGPFVAVNCAAIVESLLEPELFGIEDRAATGVHGRPGKFELAEGGTLFLDEVAELSKSAQAALLRAVQDLTIERVGGHRSRRIDTRVVAATNRPLADLVARRRFRPDLFFRLSGLEITVPPLRARPSDILELAEHFLTCHGEGRRTLAAAARDALTAYQWPGNVRELERIIQRAIALSPSPEIGLEALPAHIRDRYEEALAPASAGDASLRAWAARYVRLVLSRHGGNKKLACQQLGISFHTLQTYLAGAAPARPGLAHAPARVSRGRPTVFCSRPGR